MTTPRIPARLLVPAALGVATLVGFGGGALLQPGPAGADDTTSTTTKSDDTATKSGAAADDPAKKCEGRTPLDDATAAKVKAAALEKVPGATVDHVGHDKRNGDGYMALLTKSDGTTRVLVHEDKDFKVTSVDDPAPPKPARGPGGPGGPGRRGHDGPRGDGANDAPAAEGTSS